LILGTVLSAEYATTEPRTNLKTDGGASASTPVAGPPEPIFIGHPQAVSPVLRMKSH
jgi:hypothetical protein